MYNFIKKVLSAVEKKNNKKKGATRKRAIRRPLTLKQGKIISDKAFNEIISKYTPLLPY